MYYGKIWLEDDDSVDLPGSNTIANLFISPRAGMPKALKAKLSDGTIVVFSGENESTVEEINNLIINNSLVAGQKYKIPFTTKHLIPNTNDIHIGVTENLTLFAITSSELSTVAISDTYPNDIIHVTLSEDYRICEDGVTSRDGFIFYRKDIFKNISCDYDFRNVKFRRWNLTGSEVSGSYSSYDTSINIGNSLVNLVVPDVNDYEDYYTFENLQDPVLTYFVNIEKPKNLNYNNLYFKIGASYIDFKEECQNSTFLNTCSKNKIYKKFSGNIFACDFSENIIMGAWYFQNVYCSGVFGAFSYNKIFGILSNCDMYSFTSNTIIRSMTYCTTTVTFSLNIIEFITNTVFNNGFTRNKVLGIILGGSSFQAVEDCTFTTENLITALVDLSRVTILVKQSTPYVIGFGAPNPVSGALRDKLIDKMSPDGSLWYTSIDDAGVVTNIKVV